MLTRKQHELLMFIHRRLTESGVSPSFDEMKEALSLKSKSGIHRLITGLEERGFIRRLPHKARALDVLRLPDVAAHPKIAPVPAAPQPAPAPVMTAPASPSGATVLTPKFGRTTDPKDSKHISPPGTIATPLLGKIAAGTPIEALADQGNTIDVPVGLLGPGEHYALEVDGDSMVEDGIRDGDTILIRRCDTAENGAIVVALVDEAEATLKYLRKLGRTVELVPANRHHQTQTYSSERVRVQGRLVGLIRRY